MTPADADAVIRVAGEAFGTLAERQGRARREPTEAMTAALRLRTRHLVETDPQGAWVAEAGGAVVGATQALRRDGVWGLSLLVVEPGWQGRGVGRGLLQHALAYETGCRGGIILSSDDPAAMRSYALAGFELRPAIGGAGQVRREGLRATPDVREGGVADLELAHAVGRELRGAGHGPDLEALLAAGAAMLVLPERGFAFHREGVPLLLGARDADAARALLRASLAAAAPGEEVSVWFLTAAQAWAVDVLVEAGLRLEPSGPVCVRGELGPLAPYLPSGSYL